EALRTRTKEFAVRIVSLYKTLPRSANGQVLGKQLLRCGTSVAANYRAACRARSRAEWIANIGRIVEESDESVFWLELLSDWGIVPADRLKDLPDEAHQWSALLLRLKGRHAGRASRVSTYKLPITKLPNAFL